MGGTSRSPKPSEWASKVNHTHIISDPFIKSFIRTCRFPRNGADIDPGDVECIGLIDEPIENPIRYILAVDGGYALVQVRSDFPSSQFAFLQFGAVLFSLQDLESLSERPFIFPEDMQRLHDLQRFKLAMPIRNIVSGSELTLKSSIRRAIYNFFMEERDQTSFMETLKWFLFEEYRDTPEETYVLGSDPNTDAGTGAIALHRKQMNPDYTFSTSGGRIYLTDVFRLHETVDEEQGAQGILGYLTRVIEQLILVHFIRFIYKNQKDLLNEFLFISDGPLSFSGQTANMHIPMRRLCNYLTEVADLFLVGVEKSGPFVEHAIQISKPNSEHSLLGPGEYILLSNEYIYKYVMPGDSTSMHYGSTSYYSAKAIFHSREGQVLVVTVPTKSKECLLLPGVAKFLNLEAVLVNLQKLRCTMYDDSLVPIAIANKLVSLANHPSRVLLEKFASSALGRAER